MTSPFSDIIVFSVHTRKGVFKKHRFQIAPLWRAFSNGSVSVIVFIVVVWTIAISGAKQLRFRLKKDQCGPGLIRIKSYVMPDFETIFFRGTDFPAVQVSLQWLRKTFWILVITHSKYMNEYKNRKNQCWKRWLISVWNVYKVLIIVAL